LYLFIPADNTEPLKMSETELKPEEKVTVTEGEESDDEIPELESAPEAAAPVAGAEAEGGAGKHSRSEKESRKAMAKLGLKLGDLHAECRLYDVEMAGCAGHVPLFRQAKEVLHLPEFHWGFLPVLDDTPVCRLPLGIISDD
jgi:hypothetical protein